MAAPVQSAVTKSLKVAKGMRDYGPAQMAIRESVLKTITGVFKRHGAIALDTPVCELKETLTGKYGEDSKLIYDLADQGGELLSLRYDLTVPFARYLSQNKISNLKRYQIAKVYRRDQPSFKKGRYREFYQCDFDIAGTFDSMIPDVECVRIVCEILRELQLTSDFTIKLNHRLILDGLFEVCGVPVEKFRPICSSVDKLDKMSWSDVRTEMVNEKGLDESVADRIGEFVKFNGGQELVDILLATELGKNERCKSGLEDMRLLLQYASAMQIESNLRFDLSLARGLDYYTGVIYEAVLLNKDMEVGSIAAGGRYDTLVNTLTVSSKFSTPCVGVSIGIERIFSILEKDLKESDDLATSPTQVYVVSVGKGLTTERMKLVTELWNADINAEHSFKNNAKPLQQFQYCEQKNIPFALIIGGDELARGEVKLRDTKTRQEECLARGDYLQALKQKLAPN